MSNRNDRPDRNDGGAAHRRAWDTIPWIVNGSAGDAQRHAVEAHLRDCDDCRAELERQRALHAALSAPEGLPGEPGVPEAERGLARLMARIDETRPEGALPVDRAAPHRRHGVTALMCALAGAVVLEAVGIAVLAVDRRGDADAPYRTLTQASPALPQATLRVVPAPSMTMAELQQLLLDLRLQIVAGPNEAGAYALAPLARPPSLESQLSRLRTVPGVRFAEPIGAPETPR
jgi:hypothetical protein